MNTRLLMRGLAVSALVVGMSSVSAQAADKPDLKTDTRSEMKSKSERTDMAKTDAAMGHHSMTGEVTKVSSRSGWIDVKTAEGSMKLHFPPDALQNLKKGDRVTVDLAMTRTAAVETDKPARTKR